MSPNSQVEINNQEIQTEQKNSKGMGQEMEVRTGNRYRYNQGKRLGKQTWQTSTQLQNQAG